ncbi:unnamed protein product [Didymodactylos carnosus]|uniref:Uncharacterized protein n=1 Tax=Didymodactylos carnosus TaxID=1234261 RepID=A0A8S2WM63_9BILA|nr:unnamed protein product [Didymodactylos carnosus]
MSGNATTNNKFVTQKTSKRGFNFDDDDEEDEEETQTGTDHFARSRSVRKTVKRRSPGGAQNEESRSPVTSSASNGSSSAGSNYTTTVPNDVLRDLTSSIKGQISDLGRSMMSLARQTKELMKQKKLDYETDPNGTYLKELLFLPKLWCNEECFAKKSEDLADFMKHTGCILLRNCLDA